MIERHWDGIAAYCPPENKVSLSFVEGLNNKIRVLQRRAYGLRDEEYLRLKILTCMLPALWEPSNHPHHFLKTHYRFARGCAALGALRHADPERRDASNHKRAGRMGPNCELVCDRYRAMMVGCRLRRPAI